MKARALPGALILTVLTLAGCGGGGTSPPPTPQPTPTPTPTATITGVAAVGDPLVAATITAKAQNGTTKTATSASDGSFTVDVSGLTGPFLLQAASSDGHTTLYSSATGSGTTNIDPFTDIAIQAYYQALGTTVSAVFGALDGSSLIPGSVDLHNLSVTLDSALGPVLLQVGVSDVTAFDMFGDVFRADGTGFDKLLHATAFNGLGFQTSLGTLSATSTLTATANAISVVTQVKDSADNTESDSRSSLGISAGTQQEQANESAAVTAIDALWTNLLSVVKAKGTALQATDLAPFMDANFLDRGRNSAFFGGELAALLGQISQSHTLTLVPGAQIFAFGKTAGGANAATAEVDLTVADSAGATYALPVFKYEDDVFNADGRPGLVYVQEADGSYKLYGDQSIAYTALYIGSYDTYAASGASSGTQFGLSAFAPFATAPSTDNPAGVGAVASIAVTSDAAQLPACTGTAPYALGQSSLPLPQAINGAGAALTLNGTELFTACISGIVTVSATPPAGTQYAVTYTTPASVQSGVTAEVHAQTSEIPHLSMIGGQDPATFLGANHIADVVGQTMTVNWSLPSTFAVNFLSLDCNAIDGLGNQHLLAPTFLPPTATGGTTATIPATLPSTNLPTAAAACFVHFVGVDGELLTANFTVQ